MPPALTESRRAVTAGGAPLAGRTIWIALILLLVAATMRPQVDLTRGDFPLYLQAESFARGRLDVEVGEGVRELSTDMAFRLGRYYSHFPPGTSLLLVPFYLAGRALDAASGGRAGEQEVEGWVVRRLPYATTHLANLVFLGVILALVLRMAVWFGLSTRWQMLSVVLVVFAAPFWHVASHLNTHLPSTMLTLAGTVFVFESRRLISRRLVAGGLAAGLAILVRPPNAVLVALLAGYVLVSFRHRFSALAAFAGPAALGVLLALWLNAAMFGGPFESGYRYDVQTGRGRTSPPVILENKNRFTMPFAEGLLGLTIGAISPRPPAPGLLRHATLPTPSLPWDQVRGLLWLMPVLVFAPAGFAGLWRAGKGAESLVLSAHFLIFLCLYSGWLSWFAHAHTPLPSRFLSEAYPGGCVAIAAAAQHGGGRLRMWLRAAAAWSIGAQALVIAGVYFNFFTGVDPAGWPAAAVAALLAALSGAAALPYAQSVADGVQRSG